MLVVLAGRPGTGKTTLARLLAARLGAAHVRVDSIEAALRRAGLSVESIGSAGYVVARAVAASCLAVGTPVVIDAVSPVAEARRGWRELADAAAERLTVIELEIGDQTEHRRRVEHRRSDIDGLTVPTWPQVAGRHYQPWDEARDGPRVKLAVDAAPEVALAAVLAHLGDRPGRG